MNKKVITSLLVCSLCISNFTIAYAKEKTSPKVNSNYVSVDASINIEDYLTFKGNLLKLKDKVPNNEKQSMQEFIDIINKSIKNNEIEIDKNTFEILKVNSSVTTRDVEPGEWYQVGYMSHSTIEKISSIAGTIGIGTSVKDVYEFAKAVYNSGISGISKGNFISFFLNVGVTAGIYNLKSACEDNNHKGAYILKYGDNNMYMPYHKPTV